MRWPPRHRLVYGGGQNGLMGTAARAAGRRRASGGNPRSGLGRSGVPGSEWMIYTSHMQDHHGATCGCIHRAPRRHRHPGVSCWNHHPPESRLPPEADSAAGWPGLLRPLLQMLKTVAEGFARPGLKEMYHLAERQEALDYIGPTCQEIKGHYTKNVEAAMLCSLACASASPGASSYSSTDSCGSR